MNKNKKSDDRRAKAIREAKLKEDMKLPLNKFLNETDKDGKLKYPMALKLRNYFIMNPDPVLDSMRLGNALLHEIRFHKDMAKKYYNAHLNEKGAVEVYDKLGKVMTREECYTSFISETQVNYLVLSKLRSQLTQNILAVVDEDLFTFQQYNDYVSDMEVKIKELGYELFPEKISILRPL